MSTVPRSAPKLLDRSIAYFKRELPLDSAKALYDVVRDLGAGSYADYVRRVAKNLALP
jgi:hypothetical protein